MVEPLMVEPLIEKRKKELIITGVVFVLIIWLGLLPYLRKKSAHTTVKQILTYWTEGDSASGAHYWVERKKFPPIYDLESFKINKPKYSKEEGRPAAKFTVVLNFPQGHMMPSGKTWVCNLRYTPRGWRVTEFHIKDRDPFLEERRQHDTPLLP